MPSSTGTICVTRGVASGARSQRRTDDVCCGYHFSNRQGGGGYYGGSGGGGSGFAPGGTTTTGAADPGDGQVTLTFTQDCPTATLTLEKECLGTMTGGPWAIEVRDSTNALVQDPADQLGCGQSLAQSYRIFVLEEYTVLETEVPSEADDVRYRGACDGDGTLTASSPGQDLTCVVSNVNLVDLIVQKNCSHPLLMHNTFEIKVYRENVSAQVPQTRL